MRIKNELINLICWEWYFKQLERKNVRFDR